MSVQRVKRCEIFITKEKKLGALRCEIEDQNEKKIVQKFKIILQ
jgi:hypothetical protein